MMCSEDPIHFPSPLSPLTTFDSFWFSNKDFHLSIPDKNDSSSPDNHHHPSLFSSSPEPNFTSPNSVSGSPGGSGSDDHLQEKRQRRKLSNRESARRSRLRKKQHLEILDSELTRLTTQNRDYKERLALALHYCHVTKYENHRLRVESLLLQNRLADLNRARANLVKINLMRMVTQQQQQLQFATII